MITRIRGRLVKQEDNRVVLDVGGLFYDITVSAAIHPYIQRQDPAAVELVTYHYLTVDKNKSIPVMIGFSEELEREFFEKFISVSGIGPKAAIKAFDKPIPRIAQAIEDSDIAFLKTLDGIGNQKAKQIVAYLQGKVGRFALIREEQGDIPNVDRELIDEAKEVLRRLQYSPREIDSMVEKALSANSEVSTVEDFLNEVYRQRS
ncbi:MAG: helix-hairpin-helix domain-containing protein [Candidatus Omnitrophica bacterium]|nr:helix-hairpin-helix domain-containing protein [Candidatus Omnitrophota bacterium]